MTGYGRGESDDNGAKVIVEVNGVNRKQTEIVINLPRILGGLEPQIRQTIHERISRGRINVLVACEPSASQPLPLALDTALAHSYHDAMRSLQKELGVA
ncbi:MAG TPA: YicC/YloC family endoribonuclease, partial [Chthoniobacterales bacterium]|nr:YicC/YloC family endoribonuclease [Chthoniobacterales bacterium]